MATEVVLPMLGITIEKGKILRWLKSEGDRVEKGESIFEVEADKVTTEVESPASGILKTILVPENIEVPVLTMVAVITAEGEELPEKYLTGGAGVIEPPKEAAPGVMLSAASPHASETTASELSGPLRAVPAARKAARQYGIDLSLVPGSGPGGTILKKDVEHYMTTSGAEVAATEGGTRPTRLARPTGSAYDVAVIGAGPGGYVAAIRAAQMGARVLVIEKDKLGGTCVNWGCIPTKAFLSDVKPLYKIRVSPLYEGKDELSLNIEKMVARKNQVVETMTKGIAHLFKTNAIHLVQGIGSIVDTMTIAVAQDGKRETHKANSIIIATGSQVASIPTVSIDGKRVVSSDEVLDLQSVPKELVIVGGGVIGVEFATIFNALGTRVTVVEMLPSIVSTEDDEVIRGLRMLLEGQGITVLNDTKVMGASSKGGKVQVEVQDKSGARTHLTAEKVLMAVGRIPHTQGLGLQKVGVKMEGGFIGVNGRMETNVDGIYAIGDVIGKTMLAHAASAEGVIAVENIMGRSREIDYRRIPSCVYTFPEIASVGLTEKEARERRYDVEVGKFPYLYSGKALAMGEPEGFVKVIAEKQLGEILGVHILGENATELIGEVLLAMNLEASIEDLGQVVKGHPTLSETVMEAALDWSKISIHRPPKE